MSPKDLAERESKAIALAWLDAAVDALVERSDEVLTRAALATNFALTSRSWALRLPFVAIALATYRRSRAILEASETFFHGVTDDEARVVFPSPTHADIPPAYAIFGRGIYFTPRFEPYVASSGRGFGPLCRAAMVLHESVHVVDRLSGHPAVHVSEWDEPRFSAQHVLESIHNPSAYASFAAQIHEARIDWPRDVRYGAGRRAD
jgi:hypothetical protein